jgi:hypothetical protein
VCRSTSHVDSYVVHVRPKSSSSVVCMGVLVTAADENGTRKTAQLGGTSQPSLRLLRLEDSEPNNPGVFVIAVQNRTVGETVLLGSREQLRHVAIETEIDDELAGDGVDALFTVELL